MRPEKKPPRPPRGFARLAFRLPIYLYKLNLGWLLGKRALLLQHKGRQTGLLREAVLEVVRFDPDENTFIIAAGFGETSDWYQNLLHTPQASIQVARQKYEVSAEQVSQAQAVNEYETYAHNHPAAFKALSTFLGGQMTGSEADYPYLASVIPLIRLCLIPSE
jgi:deazaflavin-dependent oxidoreductase (nitroreductase family)